MFSSIATLQLTLLLRRLEEEEVDESKMNSDAADRQNRNCLRLKYLYVLDILAGTCEMCALYCNYRKNYFLFVSFLLLMSSLYKSYLVKNKTHTKNSDDTKPILKNIFSIYQHF